MNKQKLFESIKIGNVEIKNRIAMAPMANLGLITPDGCFTKRAVDYYVERAKGGTGLIITGAVKVENEIETHHQINPCFPFGQPAQHCHDCWVHSCRNQPRIQ